MNEGLANGAGDFNVFSALNGGANFQDISSAEIDDDAAELNLVKAVASGEKIDTSFTEESEAETTEEYLSDERRSEICQNVVSAACASCAAAGTCSILRMRNFAEEQLQPAAEEPESYLSELMNDDCDFVVAGYVSADNKEKPSESIEKDSPLENEKPEFVSEKPAVKSEVSDDDASMRVSAESNEANKPTDDECLDSESASSENIPSAKIIKENIQPKINEEPDETEVTGQINLMDSEYIDEKVDIHKEDISSENQAPQFVDKEDELPRELPIKKDSYIGAENNINSAPILEDSIPKEGLAEKVIPNEPNSSPVRDFIQVNNEIDMEMDNNNNALAEAELSDEVVRKRIESENKKDLPTLPQRDFEESEVCFEDSENVAVAEISDDRAVVSESDDLGDCAELSEEATRELEELPTNKSEVIGQFTPDLKLADDEIDQNNIVDEVVKKVAEKAELAEECRGLVATDDCDEVKCSVKIEESSDYCDDTDNLLSRDLNIPIFQEISTLPDNSSEEKANYNYDEDVANNTNIYGVYSGHSGLWVDDSPLNPEDDKTSNSYGVNMFLPLVELLGFLAIKTSSIKQEIIIR